jgi:transcription termination/antitermination protein NusG
MATKSKKETKKATKVAKNASDVLVKPAKTVKAADKKKAKAKKTAKAKSKKAPVDVVTRTKKEPNKDNQWFVLNTQSGYENSVRDAIKQRVDVSETEDVISEILVPTQKKIIVKNGKQVVKDEKIFPGYVLIKMKLDENTWTLIQSTDGVRGFVKTDKYPRPLPEQEVRAIMKFMEVEQPSYESSFSVGEAVKIIDGAFADFIGNVTDIDPEKGKVTVMISFLGREAPYELEMTQVSKL